MGRHIFNSAVLLGLCMSLCICGRALAATAPAAPTTKPAPRPIVYPDYSSPRRAVETFIWAVESHDSGKISACLYGETPLEQKAAKAFADMTAAMGLMLADAKKKLGPPPGRKHPESVTARLEALKAALPTAKVTITTDHATIQFTNHHSRIKQGPLFLIRHGTCWKMNVEAMLHLKHAGLTDNIIKRRIADEQLFTKLLQGMDADVRSGKIKSWKEFTVDFESRMLADAARREALKQAAHHPAK